MAKKQSIASKFGSSFNVNEFLESSKNLEKQVKKESLEKIGSKETEITEASQKNQDVKGKPESEVSVSESHQAPNVQQEKAEKTDELETAVSLVDNETGKGKKVEIVDLEEDSFMDFFEKFELGKEDKYTNITISDSINFELKVITAFYRGATIRDLACNILSAWLVKYKKDIEKLKKGKK